MNERQSREHGQQGGDLFCDLSNLDDPKRKRRALLAQWLQVGTVDIDELPDGYRLHLDPVSLVAQNAEGFVALERLCCPFLRISLHRNPGDGGVVIEVGGSHEHKLSTGARSAAPQAALTWTWRLVVTRNA